MIKANALRVGNYVRVRDYILCVKAISQTLYLGNNSHSEFIHDGFNYSNVEPIQLTPEILEMCGFEKQCWDNGDANGCCFIKSNHNFSFEYSTWGEKERMIKRLDDKSPKIEDTFVIDSGGEHNEIDISHINYLHEFQNLYFALTGEELKVDL